MNPVDVLLWVFVIVVVMAVLFVLSAAVAGVLRAFRKPSRAQAWDEGWDAAVAARGLPDVYTKYNPYRKEKSDG